MAKKNEIRVSRIVIDLNGEKVKLTPDQATELKKVLNDLFPSEKIKIVKEKEYTPYIPYRWIWDTPVYTPDTGWRVTCDYNDTTNYFNDYTMNISNNQP